MQKQHKLSLLKFLETLKFRNFLQLGELLNDLTIFLFNLNFHELNLLLQYFFAI